MTTVTLSKPLKTHNGETTSITLKEPTARLFFEYGEPFKIKPDSDGNLETTYNNAVFSKFLASMTGIDDILLGSLTTADYVKLRYIATSLIMSGAGENPSSA